MKKILSFVLAFILTLLCFSLSASAASGTFADSSAKKVIVSSAATPDEISPDTTAEEQFKYFLLYELEDARKSGKSDQEILDEKAKELGLTPYQVYTCLEDLGMRDQVNWDFKLWVGITPAFKGECFRFGLNGFMPAVPGTITGYITYDDRGIALEEGLKDYPFSGLNFPLATEEYGNLYDVSYTLSNGRVDFTYTLKNLQAAEAFFGIGGGATSDEAEPVRIRLVFFTGVEKVIAEEGRYNNAQSMVEIKDTAGNWLYHDGHASQSGYGIQGMFPMPYTPLPEDYIGYEPTFILGDADKDGFLTVIDATVIQKYLAMLITEDRIDLTAADTDRDGIVTVLDATRIQKYKAKLMNMDGSVPYREN